jgi:hypothetical protein
MKVCIVCTQCEWVAPQCISSPMLFGLIFNALLLALKAVGVGHRTISGLRSPASGFADDLVLVTRSCSDMSSLLQVVSDFCAWSRMKIKREKAVITCFDYKQKAHLLTASILFRGEPLASLPADEAFAYLSLVPPAHHTTGAGEPKRKVGLALCLKAEKDHVVQRTQDITSKIWHHKYLVPNGPSNAHGGGF